MLNANKLAMAVMLLLLFGLCGVTWAAGASGEESTVAQLAADRDWTQLDEDEEELEVWDPIEPFNRGMFWFNDKLYFHVIKPVARGYRFVTPEPVRESVGNVFTNLAAPVRIVNALLQLKLHRAGDELLLCVANTIFGVGGIFKIDGGLLEQEDGEDFGQTLGHYGTPSGFYLVLPILGPSNARDAVGRVADSLAHPVPSLAFAPEIQGYQQSPVQDEVWNTVTVTR